MKVLNVYVWVGLRKNTFGRELIKSWFLTVAYQSRIWLLRPQVKSLPGKTIELRTITSSGTVTSRPRMVMAWKVLCNSENETQSWLTWQQLALRVKEVKVVRGGVGSVRIQFSWRALDTRPRTDLTAPADDWVQKARMLLDNGTVKDDWVFNASAWMKQLL